jgi:hypothetical protein
MSDARDDDFLDTEDIDFAEHAVADEEVALLPLFPDGVVDESKAAEWKKLFENGKS